MLKSKLFYFLLIGVLLSAAIVVAALFLVDPAIFRDQMETRATAAFGRPFRIDGAIDLERSLRPRIVLQSITMDNPDWATSEHFARADKVAVQVALIPLLLGDLKVLDVLFAGLEVFIEEGPGGLNNYTFGAGGDRKAPGQLPSIDYLVIREAIITFRSMEGDDQQYEISSARLWNSPGAPERIEVDGFAKGMRYSILFTSDSPAELSSPQDPWSVALDMQGPSMKLTIDGQMAQAFAWNQFNGRIVFKGDRTDQLGELIDADLPSAGPFQVTAALRTEEGIFRFTDMVAQVQGLSGIPDIRITDGETSVGPEIPIHAELQGLLGDVPLAFTFESELPIPLASQTAPWPLAAGLRIGDTRCDVQGALLSQDAGKYLVFDGQLQGQSWDELALVQEGDFPASGPYRLTFQARIGETGYEVTDLEGRISDIENWQTVEIENGRVSGDGRGTSEGIITAKVADVPLSLSFQEGPESGSPSGTSGQPLQFEATIPGTVVKGKGTIFRTDGGPQFQMATTITGNRLETLGTVLDVSLPPVEDYVMSASVHSGDEVHDIQDLKAQIGRNQLRGHIRWEEKTPRPLLSGQLSTDSLVLKEFSKPAAPQTPPDHLNRPIDLDGLNDLDVRLDIDVNRVADSAIRVEKVHSTVTISDGRLNAPFQARVAGAPVDGRIQLSQPRSSPSVSLQANVGRFDAGPISKQLGLPEIIEGRVEKIAFKARSSGPTLQALLAQAEMTLQVSPSNLRYAVQVAGQPLAITFKNGEVVANSDRPLSAALEGMIEKVPFKATLSSAGLPDLLDADKPLPVRVALQTADVQLKADGTVARPLEKNVFDLNHELTGSKIEELLPLVDLALPLQGEFRAKGTIAARGSRFTLKEDLTVGKSNLKATLTVMSGAERANITADISSQEIHLDDIKFFEGQAAPEPAVAQRYVIPDYTIPVDALLAMNLDLNIQVERIITRIGTLGNMVSQVALKDGRLSSSFRISGFAGAYFNKVINVDATVDPPYNRFQLDVENLNFGYLRDEMIDTGIVEGSADIHVDLSGQGATQRSFLRTADGVITIIGGPGRITGRRLELWAADLIPTLLSPRWQRQRTTEVNCFASHIKLHKGLATIDDLLLDTRRITIAASGTLDLETEALQVFMAPRPKRASLVSLANPVEITGTLARPEVSVARLPSVGRFRLAAGLINPAFLLTAFTDFGTNRPESCDAAISHAYQAAGMDSP